MITDNLSLSDLLNVGTEKALGYLPLPTIVLCGGDNAIVNLIMWALDNKYCYKCLLEREAHVSGGALYIWDEIMLGAILQKYRDILVKAGIPITPEEYVDYIINNVIWSQRDLPSYIIIGLTFGDKRFTGRSLEKNISIYEIDPLYVSQK